MMNSYEIPYTGVTMTILPEGQHIRDGHVFVCRLPWGMFLTCPSECLPELLAKLEGNDLHESK